MKHTACPEKSVLISLLDYIRIMDRMRFGLGIFGVLPMLENTQVTISDHFKLHNLKLG